MSNQETERGELREYLDVIKARRVTILVVFFAVLAITLALSYRQSPQYVSNARLLVTGIPHDSSGITPVPDLGTEAEVVRSIEVAMLVRKELDLTPTKTGAEELLSGISVTPLTDTQVLSISYTASDPQFAADAANSFTKQYVIYKKRGAKAALEPEFEKLIEEKKEAVKELEQVRDDLDAAQAEGDLDTASLLEQEQTELIVDIQTLEQRITSTDPSRGIAQGGGSILEPATPASAPSSPNHRANGTLGAVLGLVLALGAGFAKDRLDSRFRSRADVERTLATPVLATVPRFKVPGKNHHSKTIVAADPRSSATESYRTLRTNLQFLSVQRGVASVVITSPSSNDGKTVTTANLGAALGQAGQRVVLVSADLRRPALESYFGLNSHDPGLSDWLVGRVTTLGTLIKKTDINNVSVLPSGPIPQNPAELLTSPRLITLIDTLGKHFDVVLFDVVPCLALADAAIIASRADAAILVIDASSTHRTAAIHAKEELERVGGQLLGSVLNLYDSKASPYYYYNYTPSKAPSFANGNGAGNGLGPRASKRRRQIFGRRR